MGLELNGLIIKHVISGSPAHQSSQISEGDLILRIDHRQVTECDAIDALDGSNIPGSSVVVSVQKNGTGQVLDVILVRTVVEIVEQGRLLLDLLSNLKVRSYVYFKHEIMPQSSFLSLNHELRRTVQQTSELRIFPPALTNAWIAFSISSWKTPIRPAGWSMTCVFCKAKRRAYFP